MACKQLGLLLTVVMLVLAFDCRKCNTQEVGKVLSIRSNAVIGVEDSQSVLHRDSRSFHRSRRSVLNSTEMQKALDTHNRLRRLEGASDMELMTWNSYLASMADDWVKNCEWKRGQPYRDPSTLPYKVLGQNLYYISGAPLNITAAVQKWYDEKPYFNYDTLQCQPEASFGCGHYTQVVWATSREIGCAYTNCSTLDQSNLTSSAMVFVCYYGPTGNVEGQKPYQIGTACSRCATGSWWCNEGLCDECVAVCQNSGSMKSDNCSCSCTPGWQGTDCSVACNDSDSRCNPQSGEYGWPSSYCSHSEYGAATRRFCPAMCKICQAVGKSNNFSTSTKTLLLSMLAVWLSRYSLGNI